MTGRKTIWRVGSALLGVISLVAALAVTGTVASAAAASPWTVTAGVAPTPTGGLPDGSATEAALKLTALADGSTVQPGDQLTYVLQVVNTGGSADGGAVTVVDDLSDLLTSASITSTTDQLKGQGLVLDADKATLSWTPSAPIAQGQYATASFQVTVHDDVTGDVPLKTSAAPQGETCDVDDCATSLTVQGAAASTSHAPSSTQSADQITAASAPSTTTAAPTTTTNASETSAPRTETDDASQPSGTSKSDKASKSASASADPTTDPTTTPTTSPSSGHKPGQDDKMSQAASAKTAAPSTTKKSSNPKIQPHQLSTLAEGSGLKQLDVGSATPQATLCSGGPGHVVAGFEIDGNLCRDDSDNVDWSNATGVTTATNFTAVKTTGDGDPVSDWQAGGSPAQDSLIDRLHAYATNVDGHYYVIAGWHRVSGSGTSGFIIEVATKGDTVNDHGISVPDRADGGTVFYLSADGGGDVTLSKACSYTSAADYPGDCSTSGLSGGFSYAVNHHSVSDPLVPGGASYEKNTFVEVALDLTKLTGFAPACPPNESVVETLHLRSYTGNERLQQVGPGIGLAQPNGCAHLRIHKGGVRSGSYNSDGNGTTVSGLQGATFTVSPSSGVQDPTCTTGSDGTCTIAVPAGHSYTVSEVTPAPNGWYANPTLDTGDASSGTEHDYQWETATLDAGDTYDVPGDLNGNSSHDADGTYWDDDDNQFSGMFANSRNDPELPKKCGLNIALVMDTSGSMGDKVYVDGGWTSKIDLLQDAATNVVTTLLPGTPTKIALYKFADGASRLTTLTNNVTTLTDDIDDLGADGGTNWDQGLYQVVQNHGSDKYDLVVILTDGNPTTDHNGTGGGNDTRFANVSTAIFSANAVKMLPNTTGGNTRLVAIGIGVDGGEENLRAISGPDSGSDYYPSTAGGFADDLYNLATGNCQGRVTVHKQIEDPDGNLIQNSTDANGWQFTGSISSGSLIGNFAPTAPQGSGDDIENGYTSADVTIPAGATPTITLTETLKNGYSFVGAQCAINGENVTTTTGTDRDGNPTLSFQIEAEANAVLTCAVTNKQPKPTLTLVKNVHNGNTGATAGPSDWILTAKSGSHTYDGPGSKSGTTYEVSPGTYGLSESGGPTGYTASAWSCTNNGDSSTAQQGSSVAVAVGDAWTCTITNTAEQPTLTLVKHVDNGATGGTATADEWTLKADGPVTKSGAGSENGTTYNVKVGTYTLSESGSIPGYTNGASWTCTNGSTTKDDVTSVTVAPGDDWTCTITNTAQQSTLKLVKKVANDNGGTAEPTDWTLSADGPTQVTNVPTGTKTDVTPGVYTLSESDGPSGYAPSAWDCGAATVTDGSVSIALGEHVTCTITNDDIAPHLTLKKQVRDLDGNLSYSADWRLTATSADGSATPINGKPTDAANGIGANVTAGVTYKLSEKDGPTGYTAGDAWSCVADTGSTMGTFTSPNKITLKPGQNVTCTMVNVKDFQPLTVSKTVTATYDRTDHWTIQKKVNKTTVMLSGNGVATFDYTVIVTPTDYTDKNWSMTGTITVSNPNDIAVTTTVTDTPDIGGGATCTVTDGKDVSIPAHGDKIFDYTCAIPQQPHYTTGTNKATATWTWKDQEHHATSDPVDVTFQIAHEYNATITVTDDKTDPTKSFSLGSWDYADGQHDFTYSVGKSGTPGQCVKYTNTAQIVETGQKADQSVTVCQPEATVSKSVDVKRPHGQGGPTDEGGTGTTVQPGDVLTWTITVTNPGSIAYTGKLFTDTIEDSVLNGTDFADDLGAFTIDPSSGSNVSLAYNADTHTVSGTTTGNGIAGGDTVKITYSGTVVGQRALTSNSIAAIANTVTPVAPVTCASPAGCTTNNPVGPAVQISKSVTKGNQNWDGKRVDAGDVLTWTITVHNTGTVVYHGDLFTDDLSNLHQGVDLTSLPASSDTDQVVVDWSSPALSARTGASGLAVGSTVTVSYTGQVSSQATLVAGSVTHVPNAVVPAGTVPECSSDDACSTDNPLTPHASVSKTVDVSRAGQGIVGHSGTEVQPEDHLAWTITVTNTSSMPFKGDLFTDSLASAIVGTDLDPMAQGAFAVSPAGSNVVVTPTASSVSAKTTASGIPANSSVEISYSGYVRSQDYLNKHQVTAIANTVVSHTGTECTTDCTTTNPLSPAVNVSKSVTKTVDGKQVPWDGKKVDTGDVLTWTITLHNGSSVTYDGDLFTDDLSDLLQGVELTSPPASSDADQVVVDWSSPALSAQTSTEGLAADSTVTVSYTGKVKSQADLIAGSVTHIPNVVTLGGTIPECSSDDACSTDNPLTPHASVSKTVTSGGQDVNGDQVAPGQKLTWTITVTNTSSVPYSGPAFTDNLTSTLAGTNLDVSDVSAWSSDPSQVAVTYQPKTLTGTATGLAAHSSVTVIYSAQVKDQTDLIAGKVQEIANTVVSTTGTKCTTDCTTTNPLTPKATVSKDVTVTRDGETVGHDGTKVKPGDTLAWTMTVTNTSSVPYTGTLFSDDLTSTLAGTTGFDPSQASSFTISPAGEVSVSYAPTSKTLSGKTTGAGIPANSSVTISYSASVASQTVLNDGSVSDIANTIVPPKSGPTCTSTAACGTDNPVTPEIRLSKTVSVARNGTTVGGTGTTVRPDDVLTWTIKVTNPGTTVYSGPLFTDDLTSTTAGTNLASQLVPYVVTVDGHVNVTVTPLRTGGTLTGVKASASSFPPGGSLIVTYTATVDGQETLNSNGVTAIDNTVVPPTDGTPQCTITPGCSTHNPVGPAATVSKTVTVTRGGHIIGHTGTPVRPGDTLTWTISVKNTGSVPYSGTAATDSLSEAIAGTDLSKTSTFTSSDAAQLSADTTAWPTLTVTASGLAAGHTETITYSAMVNSRTDLSQDGITTIDNTVVPGDVPTCTTDCGTTSPVAPHLMLVKDVVNGSTGGATSADWQLTAGTGQAAPVIDGPGIDNTTGPQADVAANVDYTLAESPADPGSTVTDGYAAGTWSCTNANGQSTVTLNGAQANLGDGADLTCTIVNTWQPIVSVHKTVASTVQQSDGSWAITYTLTVTNPDKDLPTTYTLKDTPGFGSGITVIGAQITAPGGTAGPAWDGTGTKTLAASRPLSAGASETWTVAIDADVTLQASDSDQQCNGTPGFGFFNATTVTSPGGSDSDHACSEPAKPVVTKTFQPPATQNIGTNGNWDGTWNLTYTVTVSNPATPAGEQPATLTYSLYDRPTFATDTTVNGGTVTGVDSNGDPITTGPGWDGFGFDIVDSSAPRSLAPDQTDTFTVTMNVTVPPNDSFPKPSHCYSEGQELLNFAEVVSGNNLPEAHACGYLPKLPTPTVTKKVASTTQQPDGSWTVVYNIAVANPSGTLSTKFDVTDTLAYGSGITVNTASVTGPGANPNWDGVNETAMASGQVLGAGATASYTVTVNATVASSTGTSPAPGTTCQPGEPGQPGAPGGFGNNAHVGLAGPHSMGLRGSGGALLDAGDQSGSQDAYACSEPVSPQIDKTAGTATQHMGKDGSWDGTWDVPYTITVTNPSDQGTNLYYLLSDTPAYPDGVTVESAKVTSSKGADDEPVTEVINDGAGTLSGGTLSIITKVGGARDLAAGATDTFKILVNAAVPPAQDPGTLACQQNRAKHGFDNVGTVTSGNDMFQASACTDIPELPTPTVTKKVASTTQQADGSWTVVYDIAVSNPSSTLSTKFDVTDSLAYGAGITVNSASVTGPGANGNWDGVKDTSVASGQLLGVGATASYTVTVNATVPASAWTGGTPATTCQPGEPGQPGAPGGFGNNSAVALAGATGSQQPQPLRGAGGALLDAGDQFGSQDAYACSEPTAPTITKTFVSAMQHADADGTWDGTWDVTYTVTVSNPSDDAALSYALTDTPAYPADVTVNGGSVTGQDAGGDAITVEKGWNGTTHTGIVTGRALPAGMTDTYTVVVNASVPDTISSSETACSQEGTGHGFDNAATATSGTNSVTATGCGNIPTVGAVTVAKKVTSLAQNPDGTWTVGYEVVVTNPSVDQSSRYHLSDTVRFGAGITLDSATVTGPADAAVNPDWTGVDPNTSIIKHRIIAPHSQERYTVTATVTVGTKASATARDCRLDKGESGTGLLNTANLSAGGHTSTSSACVSPVSPTITKTVASVTAAGAPGTWVVAYDVVVTNPSATTGLVYSLTDTPAFPADVAISDQHVSWVRSALDGSAASTSTDVDGWTGSGDGAVLAAARTLPAGSMDTYRVVVTATVPVSVTALACSPTGAGHGFFNAATVTSGEDAVTASACATIKPTIKVVATSSSIPPPPSSTPAPPPTTPPPPPTTTIAYTGVDTVGMGSVALVLLGVGVLLLLLGSLWQRKPRRH